MANELLDRLAKAVHVAYETEMLFQKPENIPDFDQLNQTRKDHYRKFALVIAEELLSFEVPDEILIQTAGNSGEDGMRMACVVDMVERDYKTITDCLKKKLRQ